MCTFTIKILYITDRFNYFTPARNKSQPSYLLTYVVKPVRVLRYISIHHRHVTNIVRHFSLLHQISSVLLYQNEHISQSDNQNEYVIVWIVESYKIEYLSVVIVIQHYQCGKYTLQSGFPKLTLSVRAWLFRRQSLKERKRYCSEFLRTGNDLCRFSNVPCVSRLRRRRIPLVWRISAGHHESIDFFSDSDTARTTFANPCHAPELSYKFRIGPETDAPTYKWSSW